MFITVPRRLLPIAVCTAVFCLVLILRGLAPSPSWRSLPLEKIGLGEVKGGKENTIITSGASGIGKDGESEEEEMQSVADEGRVKAEMDESPKHFPPGKEKPPGSTYSKMLIVPRTKYEDTTWIHDAFPVGGPVNTSIYVADDPWAPLHPPKNKGHEVMIYLSYIIDNYDDLADVNIFMHSHKVAWHNNELLGHDASLMINRLSSERVQREGFVNMRCHWTPGCPDWLHPGTLEKDANKKEEVLLAQSWSEIFPLHDIPTVLAQPCCAQFALSRERIRALPLSRYVFSRDWLLRTPLSDYLSGRVWEYVWHYLFTGQNILCPKEHVCYCDGYGICFGGEKEYDAFFGQVHEKEHLEMKLTNWERQAEKIREMEEAGQIDEAQPLDVPKFGEDIKLKEQIKELDTWIVKTKQEAMERGNSPMHRAKEVGRPWNEGDGF